MTGKNADSALFSLIRNVITGEPVPQDLLSDPKTAQEVYTLAVKHDLIGLCAHTIVQNKLLPADSPGHAAFYKRYLAAVSSVTHIEHELAAIMALFEQEQIPFVLLKGVVIRNFYPESFMRTSSDMDILVKESDLDRAVAALQSHLHFRQEGRKNYHDIVLVSPSGVPLELHFSILENTENLDRCLKKVWDHVQPLEGYTYGHTETPEFFLFHHLAHMTYHLTGGGCGVRSFLDLWLIKQTFHVDATSVHAMTDDACITHFTETAFHLAAHWLEGVPANDLEQRLASFILDGGTFGTEQTRISIKHETHGGKGKYLLRRIFPPYQNLLILYPWLKKHPYLMPAAHVHRWLTVLNPEKRAKIRKEMQISNAVTSDEQALAANLLSDLGILS